MNEYFKDYFYFSRGEKNGIIILLIIIFILLVIPYILVLIPSEQDLPDKKFEKEIELFAQSLKLAEVPEYNNRLDQYIIERYDSLKLFPFNPNSTTQENFKNLGLTDKQITTINNYINKGGKFYSKDDFRKIYGIRQQQFEILKPFLLLPDNQQNNSDNSGKERLNYKAEKMEGSLFTFDPNIATNEDFHRLGLSEKQISTIRNFQSKGGKFKDNSDFKKIYGISEAQFIKLQPYISIKKEEKVEVKVEVKEINQVIEINAATANQLIEIKGIGKYTADEIIKYRNKLGGFVNLEQLLEIKEIKQESFDFFVKNLSVNPKLIKKINLNFSEVEDFVAHPYFNYYQAKEIVKFRSTNGAFKDKKQLLDNKLLLETSYKKLEPYISLN